MTALIRFALILGAVVMFPWLASNPPDWTIFRDPDWVQAWATILAIAAGFGYVAYNNASAERHRLRNQREHRRYLSSTLREALEDVDRTYETVSMALTKDLKIKARLARDSMDVIGDELFGVTVDTIGSWEGLLAVRTFAFHAKAFAHISVIVSQGPITKANLDDLAEFREGMIRSARDFNAECRD